MTNTLDQFAVYQWYDYRKENYVHLLCVSSDKASAVQVATNGATDFRRHLSEKGWLGISTRQRNTPGYVNYVDKAHLPTGSEIMYDHTVSLGVPDEQEMCHFVVQSVPTGLVTDSVRFYTYWGGWCGLNKCHVGSFSGAADEEIQSTNQRPYRKNQPTWINIKVPDTPNSIQT